MREVFGLSKNKKIITFGSDIILGTIVGSGFF